MHKSADRYTCAGCDTSKETIDVVRATSEERTAHRRFANTAAGHGPLIEWLSKPGQPVRVVVEASRIASLKIVPKGARWQCRAPFSRDDLNI